ncbi:hypothetical protein MJT46_009591 [Ovis ammon polii x Ovis aries]|nr:hypothetical protein MJT46_009591 [Ovis ammon polii x Ovis aries]
MRDCACASMPAYVCARMCIWARPRRQTPYQNRKRRYISVRRDIEIHSLTSFDESSKVLFTVLVTLILVTKSVSIFSFCRGTEKRKEKKIPGGHECYFYPGVPLASLLFGEPGSATVVGVECGPARQEGMSFVFPAENVDKSRNDANIYKVHMLQYLCTEVTLDVEKSLDEDYTHLEE